MAVSIQNTIGTLFAALRQRGTSTASGGSDALLSTHLEDANGLPLAVPHNAVSNAAQYGLPIAVENDGNMLVLRGDRFGGVATAATQPIFNWFVEGVTLNSRVFFPFNTTFTAVQTAQGLTLNATNANTASALSQVNTFKQVPLYMKAPVLMRIRARFTQWGVANANAEYGVSNSLTTLGITPNVNGAYWRFDSSGVRPVLAYNGSVTFVGDDISSLLTATNFYQWGIIKDDDNFVFTVQDTTTGVVLSRQNVQIPGGQQKSFLGSHAQPYVRTFNSATAPASGTQVILSEWTAGLLDTNLNLTAPQIATSMGLGSEQGPLNYTTTSNVANSTVATTVVPTNTTATTTTLDGVVRMAAPAGAVTDLALFTYQAPIPYAYRNKRVRVGVKNLGAAVATTATQIDFFLCVNASAVTLAGNLNRKWIGSQTFPVGAAIGSSAIEGMLEMNLSEADMITEAGRYNILVARINTGTATASQVLEIAYANLGHFE